MESERNPTWMRIADVMIGFISLLAATWILFDISIAQDTALFVLAVALVFISFTRFYRVNRRELKTSTRALNLVVGLTTFILAFGVFLFPTAAINFLIDLIGIALLAVGAARVAIGYSQKELPTWARGFLIAIGLLMALITTVALFAPGLDYYTSILLISSAFIANGLVRAIGGASGKY